MQSRMEMFSTAGKLLVQRSRLRVQSARSLHY